MSAQREQHIRIGVDIGGTFTDLQIWDGRTGRTPRSG
jgi:N-methylhydantoinase A/oxoprolinase/acetone carboxylase beta subunit